MSLTKEIKKTTITEYNSFKEIVFRKDKKLSILTLTLHALFLHIG